VNGDYHDILHENNESEEGGSESKSKSESDAEELTRGQQLWQEEEEEERESEEKDECKGENEGMEETLLSSLLHNKKRLVRPVTERGDDDNERGDKDRSEGEYDKKHENNINKTTLALTDCFNVWIVFVLLLFVVVVIMVEEEEADDDDDDLCVFCSEGECDDCVWELLWGNWRWAGMSLFLKHNKFFKNSNCSFNNLFSVLREVIFSLRWLTLTSNVSR